MLIQVVYLVIPKFVIYAHIQCNFRSHKAYDDIHQLEKTIGIMIYINRLASIPCNFR